MGLVRYLQYISVISLTVFMFTILYSDGEVPNAFMCNTPTLLIFLDRDGAVPTVHICVISLTVLLFPRQGWYITYLTKVPYKMSWRLDMYLPTFPPLLFRKNRLNTVSIIIFTAAEKNISNIHVIYISMYKSFVCTVYNLPKHQRDEIYVRCWQLWFLGNNISNFTVSCIHKQRKFSISCPGRQMAVEQCFSV